MIRARVFRLNCSVAAGTCRVARLAAGFVCAPSAPERPQRRPLECAGALAAATSRGHCFARRIAIQPRGRPSIMAVNYRRSQPAAGGPSRAELLAGHPAAGVGSGEPTLVKPATRSRNGAAVGSPICSKPSARFCAQTCLPSRPTLGPSGGARGARARPPLRLGAKLGQVCLDLRRVWLEPSRSVCLANIWPAVLPSRAASWRQQAASQPNRIRRPSKKSRASGKAARKSPKPAHRAAGPI